MNNDDYLMALKRALAGMDAAARDEILLEIESHMQESRDQESLENKFGAVEQLARQYLDGEPLPRSLGARLGSLGSKLLLGFGAIMAIGLVIVIGLIWIFSGDKFNYADERAPQREIDASEWNRLAWPESVDLRVDQAHAVLYWHDKPELQWRCQGRDDIDPQPGHELRIRHGFCVIYLPITSIELEISQSDVVLVKPETSIAATVVQGEVRIAELDHRYRYQIEADHSEIGGFDSDADATRVIAINATESSIQLYEYR